MVRPSTIIKWANTRLAWLGPIPMMLNVRTEPGGLDAPGLSPRAPRNAPVQAAAFELQQGDGHGGAPVEVVLVFAPAITIINMVKVAGVAGVALEADAPGVPGARGVRASSLVLEILDSLLPAAWFRKAARWCPGQIEYLHREAVELHA